MVISSLYAVSHISGRSTTSFFEAESRLKSTTSQIDVVDSALHEVVMLDPCRHHFMNRLDGTGFVDFNLANRCRRTSASADVANCFIYYVVFSSSAIRRTWLINELDGRPRTKRSAMDNGFKRRLHGLIRRLDRRSASVARAFDCGCC
jgi:hypothetical protein